jgi:hypothetical protein
VAEAAAVVRRDAGWLRKAIRSGRLPAVRSAAGYLLRRRDVERLDRSALRRRARSASGAPAPGSADAGAGATIGDSRAHEAEA